LAQTGDTYHGTTNPKHSVIYVFLIKMLIVIAICIGIFLLVS
jgi:hypothetical protein